MADDPAEDPRSPAEPPPSLADFASRDPAMRELVAGVERIAGGDATLFVRGPTGAGKERLARAIHAASARRSGPFVAVHCGALPADLLETELFGQERGALAGASPERLGCFELARRGTVLLDEVGGLPPRLQGRLLTVLRQRVVRRVGGERERPIDVRILAASSRDLAPDVREGRFREDLFLRLSAVTLPIPPLSERPADVVDLADRFLRRLGAERGLTAVRAISEAALERLRSYPWPGNVRELANVIERALLRCNGERIDAGDLPEHVVAGVTSAESLGEATGDVGLPGAAGTERLDLAPFLSLPLREARRRVADAFEREYLRGLLARHAGAVGRTAREAGINPRTLYEKMRRHGLAKEDFKR